jgi:TorA maturation chaperone TorD
MALSDKKERYISLADSRLSVYNLLAALYLELPDEKLVGSIFDPGFGQKLKEVTSIYKTGKIQEGLGLIGNFITSFSNQPHAEILRCIAVDRTRLFRGVSENYSPPPPYESIYRENRLMGESTSEVSLLYSRFQVNIPEDRNEPPDYLGIELDFMRFLCASEKEAWENSDPFRAMELSQAGIDFLKDHLIQWVPRYCDAMFGKAELDFYRGLARFTAGFLEYDVCLASEALGEIAVSPKP